MISKNLFYNRQIYVTKLPFEAGHQYLLDNYSVCKQASRKLKKLFDVRNKYDEI